MMKLWHLGHVKKLWIDGNLRADALRKGEITEILVLTIMIVIVVHKHLFL